MKKLKIMIFSMVFSMLMFGSTNAMELEDNIFTKTINEEENVFEADSPFRDVNASNWYYEELIELFFNNIINGFTDGTFRGQDVLKKDQLLKLLVTTVNPNADYSKKTDIDDEGNEYVINTSWFSPYLDMCRTVGIEEKLGIIEKTDATGLKYYVTEDNETAQEISKKYNVLINREEVAKYVYKTFLIGYSTDDIMVDVANREQYLSVLSKTYKDYSQISDDAKIAIYTLRSFGIMEGDTQGNFNPKKSLTRAEATAIIYIIRNERQKLLANGLLKYSDIPGYVY